VNKTTTVRSPQDCSSRTHSTNGTSLGQASLNKCKYKSVTFPGGRGVKICVSACPGKARSAAVFVTGKVVLALIVQVQFNIVISRSWNQ
jgi:hypothetical protein